MRPTSKVICSLRDLERLRSLGIDVFTCAHHWVSDGSIITAIKEGRWDDPMIPWTRKTHRGARIGTIAAMMLHGTRFPSLRLRMHFGVSRALRSVELVDGHHRLRAYQFLRLTDRMSWAVEGDAATLRSAIRAALREVTCVAAD